MSDEGKVQREWRFYLDDTAIFAKKVQTYTQDLTQAEFVAYELAYDDTLRNLELIGEAATHIPADIREANPEIAWRLIVATRYRLVHAYLDIDDDIPDLLVALENFNDIPYPSALSRDRPCGRALLNPDCVQDWRSA